MADAVCYPATVDLDLARAENAKAVAAIQTASQRPNPNLQFPFQYASDPKPEDSPYIPGLRLDIPIETAGKRGYDSAIERVHARIASCLKPAFPAASLEGSRS